MSRPAPTPTWSPSSSSTTCATRPETAGRRIPSGRVIVVGGEQREEAGDDGDRCRVRGTVGGRVLPCVIAGQRTANHRTDLAHLPGRQVDDLAERLVLPPPLRS